MHQGQRSWKGGNGSPSQRRASASRPSNLCYDPHQGSRPKADLFWGTLMADRSSGSAVQETQQAGQDHFHRIVELHPLPVHIVDLETGELLYANPAAVTMFGYDWPASEPLYTTVHYANPEDRKHLVERLKAEGRIENAEVATRHADGSEFWVQFNARLMDLDDRKVIVSTFSDVTEAKEREAELNRTRGILEDAIESLSEGFALFDRDDRLVMCNSQYRDFHKVSAHIIKPGMTWVELMRADLDQGLFVDAVGREEEWLADRNEARKAIKRNMEYEQSDGRWIVGSNTRTRDGGIVMTLRDITNRKRRETESLEAREMLEDAIESLPQGFVVWDENDQFVMCNRSYREINKISEKALKPGVTWKEFVRIGAEMGQYTDAIGRVDEWDEERLATMTIDNVSEYQLADGRWVMASSDATRQGGRVAMRLDITERRNMEEALRESEELVRRVLEACPVPLAMSRIDSGEYIYISPANVDMLGIDFSDGPVFAPDTFVDPAVREAYIKLVREKGRVDGLEVERIGADGKPFWASMSSRLIEFKGEDVLVSSLFDLTERKQMEDALRENENMIRRVLEACPIPVAMNRPAGDYIYANPANEALFGYDSTDDHENAKKRYADPEVRRQYVAQLQRDRQVSDYLAEYRRVDGSTFWGAISARLIEHQGEDVIVSTIHDLTERHAVEAEMERQREALYQSEKLNALGTLLAGVAHELNNPLSVVSGQALLLEETTKDDRTRERATMIGEAADRCARIVKTFLAMAREEPGETTAVDLNEVVETALEVTGYTLRTAEVQLTKRLSKSLPAVHGNADQLNQVITNLVVNARQVLEGTAAPRRLTISTRRDRKRKEVVVRVSDNGPGIPKEDRRRVFEPFFTTKAVGEGTGIGLAVCHQIVEAHRGSIRIEEPRGGGAAFVIRLPEAARDAAPLSKHREAPRIRPCKVLVIDDEPDVARLLSDVLQVDGHSVVTMGSVNAALERLEGEAFDVIVSDLRLPDSSGFGVFEAFQDRRPELLARTAFMTGDTMNPKIRSFLETAGWPYAEKPLTPDDIRDLISRLITSARSNGRNGGAS